MPPKKAAADKGGDKPAKKVGEEGAEPVILEYLTKQNRPYNATDLQANLKAKFNISKPAVVKALASLAEKGDIVEKAYGKQLIYACKQPDEVVDPAEVEQLKTETAEMKEKLGQYREELKKVQADTAALESAPSTAELPSKIDQLKAEVAKQSAHLASLNENPSMMMSTDEIALINADYDKIRKIWLSRRKTGEEAAAMLYDGNPAVAKGQEKEWLEEEFGFEFDGERLDEIKKGPVLVKGVKRKS